MKILNFFSFESVLSCNNTDPDKNFFNDKLQQIDSPYFSVENFIDISEQLNKDNLSILHLNIKNLDANIDNFREKLLRTLLLNLDKYYSVYQTRNNIKGGGICTYINKELKFKLTNDIDIFNNEIETRSVEIINSKSRNLVVSGI